MTTLPTTVPANAQQAGLWFIHESDPECSAYHLALAAEVTAEPALGARVLDILSDLLAEHEALRAGLRAGPEGPEQFVAEDLAPLVHHTDCRATDPAALRTLIRDDSRVPFDLSRPPLWRVHLYRTGESTWVFAVVMHHIAADFWSLALLLTEVRARLDGTPSPFTLDGGAFAAYAARQRESLAGPRAAALLQDEAKRLADPPAGLDLYGDLPRPPVPSYDGGSTTPYTVLLSAYFVFLSRLSGQSDILVGTPTSGRLQRSMRDALGNFVNTVVVRGEVDEEATFRALLASSRTRVAEAMRAQELPFPWLVRELAPPRDTSRTPLFQAGFAWDRLPFLNDMDAFFLLAPGPDARLSVAGATLRPYPLPQQEGQTDLWVEMGAEREGAFAGVLRYSTDLFTAGTAAELAATFVSTAHSLLAAPDEELGTLPRGDARQRAALAAWGTGPEPARPA
ncbi:condensation domain-containing protein, partial [Streptomyces sp. NEAU-H3]|uniref:condensation domain-containing protein n=1 Tax=Streptomyces sp. NEAU-H3 TaxID=2720636 RepID=UPI0016AED42F